MGGFRDPLDWSLVDRTILAGSIVLPLMLLYAIGGDYVLAENPPYLEMPYTRWMLWIHTRFVIPLFVLFIACGFVVRRVAPESKAYAHIGVQFIAIAFGYDSYAMGQSTSQYMPVVLLAFAIVAPILVGKGPGFGGVTTFLGIAIGTAIAEQLGLLPHAPIMRSAPFSDGRLDASWLIGLGGVNLLMMVLIALWAYLLVSRLEERERTIASKSASLAAALTDLRVTQQRLVQSEKMAALGQLVAGVAHELNNPASFVAGAVSNLHEYLEQILRALAAHEKLGDTHAEVARLRAQLRDDGRLTYALAETPALFAIAEEGTQRLQKVIGDLRTFARSDAGERAPVKLAEGLESTLSLLGSRIHEVGVDLVRSYEPVPSLPANPDQLKQLWMNLLTNAIDAVEGRPAPRVELTIRQVEPSPVVAGSWVEVEVRDNGPGIDDAVLERMFDPFFTTKPVGRGTGLGLSISFGIVQQHGGSVEARRTEQGLAMIVRLPVATTPIPPS